MVNSGEKFQWSQHKFGTLFLISEAARAESEQQEPKVRSDPVKHVVLVGRVPACMSAKFSARIQNLALI